MTTRDTINFFSSKIFFFICLFSLCVFTISPNDLIALDTDLGETLFKNHCAGCHINGNNIIRRSKNLKISSLKNNGINDPETIANIARQGIGIMDGYKDQLGEDGDLIVANWIWEQAQKAWVQE
tara:strand:+ start:933 stop:1304 length:372 start_codon:yes stop_codon:yes gene_type:complete